jgi:hypothetical protein
MPPHWVLGPRHARFHEESRPLSASFLRSPARRRTARRRDRELGVRCRTLAPTSGPEKDRHRTRRGARVKSLRAGDGPGDSHRREGQAGPELRPRFDRAVRGS